MKKKILIVIGLLFVFTGCGDQASSDQASKNEAIYEDYASDWDVYDAETQNFDEGFSETYESDSKDAYYEYDGVSAADEAIYSDTNTADTTQLKEETTGTLDKEMLVYRGTLSIDTLDFNTSVNEFKAILDEKGGFIESESYTDSYSTSGYYAIDESYKHNVYSATVRIPSTEYDTVMNSATSLGDVRSRYSNASNVTQQYGTYQSQLEIYETEYSRYLTLLENATDDEYAFQIENELFNIQMQIATLKSNITNIENDVAYSYIDITIKEVSKYEEKPAETNTFLDRFKNTCKNSWDGFLEVLEDIVFFIVMNIYYIVIILVIAFVLWRVFRKKRAARKNKKINAPSMEIQNPTGVSNENQANKNYDTESK